MVLERIAARLGPRPGAAPGPHRGPPPEWMQMWQPVPLPRPRKGAEPKRCRNRPGAAPAAEARHAQPPPAVPGRAASADRTAPRRRRLVASAGRGVPTRRTGHVQRDYWVALSEHAGVLWIYQERLASEATPGPPG